MARPDSSSALQLRTVREMALRLERMERGRRIAHSAYRSCARRLDAALARCPADAIGIGLTELPAVWDALADRYFAAHGQFPNQPAAAAATLALLARMRARARSADI